MSSYIIDLIPISVWGTIFMASFTFGLIFLIITIVSGIGDQDNEIDTDHDIDMHDTDLHTEVGVDLDHDLDTDTGSDFDHSFDSDIDSDLYTDFSDIGDHDLSFGEAHLEIDSGVDVSRKSMPESRFLMGNVAVFFLMFGEIGLINYKNLTDLTIGVAMITAFVSSRLFAWVIANYASTNINYLHRIGRGDIGRVVYSVSPNHQGLVHVRRKDGIITTIIARGAFPFDHFDKGDQGYIWNKDKGIYLITRGRNLEKNEFMKKSSRNEPSDPSKNVFPKNYQTKKSKKVLNM